MDGRIKIRPMVKITGGEITVTECARKKLIKLFEERGSSIHSRGGGTVWVSVEHCLRNNIPFTLERHQEGGYTVTKTQLASCEPAALDMTFVEFEGRN